MRKNGFLLAIAGAALTMPAHAIIDFYAAPGLGFGNQRTDGRSHRTSTLSAEVGVDIPLVRAGLEYNHLNMTGGYDDGSVQAVMVNAYLKPFPIPIIKPYIGGGYGRLLNKSKNAYQAMLGVQFAVPVTDLYIDAEVRGLFSNDALATHDLWHYDFRVKLRYNFW